MAFDLTAVLRLRDNFSSPLRRAAKGVSTMEKAVNATTKTSARLSQTVTKTTSALSRMGAAGRTAVERLKTSTERTTGSMSRLGTIGKVAIDRVKVSADRTTGSMARMGVTGKTALDRMRSSADKTSSAIARIATAIGGVTAVTKGLNATLGGAARIELNKITLEALLGDVRKANRLFDSLMKKAMTSTFSEMDFQNAAKVYLPVIQDKDISKVMKLVNYTERLAASNPLQGFEGAAFSIREFLSGDYVSLVERFNIPRSMIREAVKGADSVEEKMAALDKVLNKLGFTQQFVTRVNKAAASQWNILKSNISVAFAKMGRQALEKLKKPLTQINDWFLSGGVNTFIEQGSSLLAGFADKLIKIGDWFSRYGPPIKDFFTSIYNTIKPIMPFIKGFVGALAGLAIAKPIIAGIAAAFRVLSGPIGWIATAAGILYQAWSTNFMGIRDKAQILFATLRKWWEEYGPQIMTTFQRIADVAKNTIAAALPHIKTIFETVWSVAGPILRLMWNWFRLVGTVVWKLVQEYVIPNLPLIGKVLENTWNVAQPILNTMKSIFEKVGSVINKVADGVAWLSSKLKELKFPKIPSWAANMLGAGGKLVGKVVKAVHGSHATGLYRVPFDGYIAELHRGERVLTAREAREYDRLMYSAVLARPAYVFNNTTNNYSGSQANTTQTVKIDLNGTFSGARFYIREDADVDKIARALAREIREAAGLV